MGFPVPGVRRTRSWAGFLRWPQTSPSRRLRRLPMGISRSGRRRRPRSRSTCDHVRFRISPGCIWSFQPIQRASPTTELPSCWTIRQRRYSLSGGSSGAALWRS